MNLATDPVERELELRILKVKFDFPMALLAIVWIFLVILELTLTESDPMRRLAETADWIIWAVFLIEYLAFLSLSHKKVHYVRENVLDLIIVFLPALRILRLEKALEVFRGATIFSETLHEVNLFLKHKKVYYLIILVLAVIAAGGVLVHIAETPDNEAFASYGDSFWWAAVTTVTLGHSSLYPLTTEGIIINITMILFGAIAACYVVLHAMIWILREGRGKKARG